MLGMSTLTRRSAPMGDPGWDLWTMGWDVTWDIAARVDRWFDIHRIDWIGWNPARLDFYRRQTVPVYMREEHKDIPSSQAYPVAAVWRELFPWVKADADGRPREAILDSSLAYMLALAIVEGRCEEVPGVPVDRIGIWGCDLKAGVEYYFERPNMEVLIYAARSRGIDVYIPKESDLCKSAWESGVYGNVDPKDPEFFWDVKRPRGDIKDFLASAGEWHEGAAAAE